MYGKLNERKLREDDYDMSCEKARQQLNQYIDIEARRVNVDSAKKRAVLQHMDYEGFRQMVLGANIFPTKTNELLSFSKGSNENPMNKTFDQNKDKEGVKTREEKQQIDLQKRIQGKSEYHCSSFREFKKKFNNSYTKELKHENVSECYKLIKEQNLDRLKKVFNQDCEGNILIKVTEVFSYVIQFLQEEKKEQLVNQAVFMYKFFETIVQFPDMKEMGLVMMTKKEKQKITHFIQSLSTILGAQSEQQINKVCQALLK